MALAPYSGEYSRISQIMYSSQGDQRVEKIFVRLWGVGRFGGIRDPEELVGVGRIRAIAVRSEEERIKGFGIRGLRRLDELGGIAGLCRIGLISVFGVSCLGGAGGFRRIN